MFSRNIIGKILLVSIIDLVLLISSIGGDFGNLIPSVFDKNGSECEDYQTDGPGPDPYVTGNDAENSAQSEMQSSSNETGEHSPKTEAPSCEDNSSTGRSTSGSEIYVPDFDSFATVVETPSAKQVSSVNIDSEEAECEQPASEGPASDKTAATPRHEESSFVSIPEKGSAAGEKSSCSGNIDPSCDYAEKAAVRTNEVLFEVRNPTVGATEATIRTEIKNNRDSHITMAGCTISDAMGKIVAVHYVPVSGLEEPASLEFDLGRDLGLVLERGTTYYYRFAVEVDGELFTHKEMSFRTVSVDDRFAFELKDAQISGSSVVIGTKVFNPTGAHVTSVGCLINSPQGAEVCRGKVAADTSDKEFLLQYEAHDLGNDGFFGPDYEVTFFVHYEGETYESYTGTFTMAE